jgi:hypothetical protein
MSQIIEQKINKKRGRKSKKEIEEANKLKLQQENISFKLEENIVLSQNNSLCLECTIDPSSDCENTINKVTDTVTLETKPPSKKRGRKPKGGKIIQQIVPSTNLKENKPNIILHLKCSIKELDSTDFFESDLEGYSFSANNNLAYINNQNNKPEIINASLKFDTDNTNDSTDYEHLTSNKDNDIREIWKKLKALEYDLHTNNIDNKTSACFWDTHEFDNPPVYIPKHFINNSYHVYGCFCSPECAVAYLMEENIDTSIKFERYQLMNHIYSKIYNYTKNIKPAPNPYYMLEKYCGNLTIQDYRSLLRNERLFLIVDKPLTRIMPELHEDNDDFIINNKIIPTNNIKLRKAQKKQTKTNILSEQFGLV